VGRAVPYVFGKVKMTGPQAAVDKLRVAVVYSDNRRPATRLVLGRSGSFCFRRVSSGGLLVLEVDGVEQARRAVPDLAVIRHREDFEISTPDIAPNAPPGVIDTKFVRQPNEKTADLYKKAAQAESDQRNDEAIAFVTQIVERDPQDFIAWAKLGSLYLAKNSLLEAQKAFERSLSIQADYPSAILNLGIVRALRNDIQGAIALFQRAVSADPRSAAAFRYLGEAYLQNRQGTLGLTALDKALELDPVGMAECHLLKARLYDLAGAKNLAATEYKAYLTKVPNSPERPKYELYIKENADRSN
jgi:tetratricopeptide (TPR) repeat protein